MPEPRIGTVRYLRPEYQDPKWSAQGGLGITVAASTTKAAPQIPFPSGLPAQVQAVRQHLQQAGQSITAGEVTGAFSGAKASQVEEIIATLVMLGQVRLTAADGAGVRYTA